MRVRRFAEVYMTVRAVARERAAGSRRIPDWVIVLTLLFAAWHNKPIFWACQRGHWPAWLLRIIERVAAVPSPTTMSRRLRRPGVTEFLDACMGLAQRDLGRSLVAILDGTPLEVRAHSKDRHATFGWSRGRTGRGYKLHLLLDRSGRILAFKLAPLDVSELEMAPRLVRQAPWLAYVLGDSLYDAHAVHRSVAVMGGQLVAPRQHPGTTLGHRAAARFGPRRRSIDLLEGPGTFGRALLGQRGTIERFFGQLDAGGEGLGELPSWVRTYPRVRAWVHAKLAIHTITRHHNRAHLAA